MPIHFICPHCGAAADIDDRFAGETGPCAQCGKAIAIPIPGGVLRDPPRNTANTLVFVMAVALGVTWLGVMVLVAWRGWSGADNGDEAARRAQCVHNLRKIAEAMQQYEAVHGRFPPAYLVDRQGRPMHSWRVLLLPYLGQQDLYDRYRLDERWDSVHNLAVTDLPIELFQCLGQPNAAELATNYMMVVGPHTISNGPQGTKIMEITDRLANTILLVEVADSTTRWAEPEDLRIDKIDFVINGPRRREISSHHPRKRPQGVNAAFCDGSVRWLKNSTNPELVKAMLTIDGGESVPSRQH